MLLLIQFSNWLATIMLTSKSKRKIKPVFKLWFEIDGKYVLGDGAFRLLDIIQKKNSLRAAATVSDMSYRYAWGLVKNIEKHLGKPIVKTHRGGKIGGSTELTETGESLLTSYKELREIMTQVCKLL